MADEIFITAAARTAIGGFQGVLRDLTAPELGGAAISAVVGQQGMDRTLVDEVIMGCVLPAGLGQAPARQASFVGGLSETVPCTTVNKMCGSGMKAVMLGYDQIKAGGADMIIAGGMESMTNAPYLLPKVRQGMRMGHGEIKDHMFLDGLEDAFERGTLMGAYAEATAERYQFTREGQDEFAIRSLKRANEAISDGTFAKEIVPVNVKNRKNIVKVDLDEQPGAASPDKIPTLRPAFAKNGTVTAANSSSISDGAAALVLMKMSSAENKGLTPLAIVQAHASHSQAPQWFTTAPIGAIKSVLDKAGWVKDEVDLFEINEAFAVVTMAAMHDLAISEDIVNIHGGACALGHPVGASGARIIVTLLNALAKHDLTKGVASLCIGGGEGVAVAIERLK